ncbi:cystathionine gamma-synthase [Liquorilactobacillus aquaticus DSM 21051]|uniref:homocysteine desulfhydrase n=2 Tax=Liquorilactobacillus aquaticus TaxID=392566 RepID=A0A0R2D439_9LACO|nr:cystathionine gamma-synthase [Liquorilactobacillus aquaticus DSM 21051]
MMKKENTRETDILYKGTRVKKNARTPETLPLYLTTAFNVDDLADLKNRYKEQGYTYIRTRNPNRNALSELVTYLEKGQNSIICSSGMAAISTTLLTVCHSGDHIVADHTLYGESIDLLEKLKTYGVSVTFVNVADRDEVEKAFTKHTVAVYTETISNPTINTIDIEKIAALTHEHKSQLIIDNTFATSYLLSPLTQGADIVVNSLTKFANGHSDVCLGSVTSSNAFIKKAYDLQVLLGTTAAPFDAWLCERGMRTMDLRVQKQSDNALELARFLKNSKFVKKVHYIGLADHTQHQLAKKQFSNGYGGMLSFELSENETLINKFLNKLTFVHYAMTLGGYRTTISHPATSSHYDMPKDQRLKLGITDGLLRVSVGIENINDLIEDFKDALTVYDV